MTTGLWTPEDHLNNTPAPSQGYLAMHSAIRQVSGPLPSSMTSLSSSPPNANTAWRTANASNTTKSSQMIERIMAENDRLKRECTAERMQREEAMRRLNAEKTIIEQIKAENSQLQILHDANERAIERKDRKIRDLQTSLDSEKSRRQSAEKREEEMGVELGRSLADSKRSIAEASAAQWQAEMHATAMADGLKRRDAKLSRQVDQMTKELEGLEKGRQEDRSKLMALEVVGSQQNQESARLRDMVTRMEALMAEYEKEKEQLVSRLEEQATNMRCEVDESGEKVNTFSEEMLAVTQKMKWALGVNDSRKEK